MMKQDVKKNRQRIRNSLKSCLSNVSTECLSQSDNNKKIRIPKLSQKNFHKKTSQEIRHFDQLMYLKETHVLHSFQSMFQKLEQVGQGAHSIVYKCRQIKTGRILAAKCFKSYDVDTLNRFKEHFMINRVVNHENINTVHYLFINEKLKKIYVICDYCPFKDLRQFMESHKKINQSTIKSIIKSIISAVSFLHGHGVCHRDLKPDNIMYNSNTGQLKLIDFQIAKMSKYIDQPLQMWTNTGSLHYKAPQMFRGRYNQMIDMWSVGVIAYELAFGKLPFDCEYVSQTIAAICEKEPDYEKPGVSPFLIQFIKGCLTKDPTKRMKCFEAFQQPFLLSYQQQKDCSPCKRKFITNQSRSLEENQNNQCVKKKYEEKEKACRFNLRRSHSSYEKFNQKNIFQNDIGIRFLQH